MKKIHSLFIGLMVTSLIFCSLLTGQSGPRLPQPQISAMNGNKPIPIQVTSAKVDVTIHGFIAETRMTLTFYNPHSRTLEGEFTFPLPEGAFISGYALDINGQMIDGVVVEKKKGREVFEKIVRRGIDPGLVEHVGGNNFKTRIFPFLPKNSRTISIRYISEINDTEYYLPLNFPEKLQQFSLRIEVLGPGIIPAIKKGAPENFYFHQWQSSYVAETTLKNFQPPEDLIVSLMATGQPGVQLEKSSDGNYYFCLPHPIDQTSSQTGNGKKPKHITILWDTSASMGKSNREKELDLLTTYLTGLNEQPDSITIDLVFFHYRREAPQRFTIATRDSETIKKIRQTLADVAYDGGTDLSTVKPPTTEAVPDIYLLFTDGIDNFSTIQLDRLRFTVPVYIFSATNRAHHAVLQNLAQQSSGCYFNLTHTTPGTIIKSIGSSPLMLMSVKASSGNIAGIFPRPPFPVDKRAIITGRLTSDTAEIECAFGQNGHVTERVTYRLDRQQATNGNQLRTYWAQQKINHLQVFPTRNRKKILETGKTFGLVTPGTSLIVLDNLNQYVEHQIMPPESLPEMRKEYTRLVSQKIKNEDKEKKNNLERVIGMWKQRINWWNKDWKEKPKLTSSKSQTSPTRTSVVMPSRLTLARDNAFRGIGGTISDPEKIPLPGISIILESPQLQSNLTTVSNEYGEYFFANIPIGTYQITATLPGFNTVVYRNIELRSGQKLDVSMIMRVSTIEESVVVTGRPPTIDRRSTQVAVRYHSSSQDTEETDLNTQEENRDAYKRTITLEPGLQSSPRTDPIIAIKGWEPQTPYIKYLKKARNTEAYNVYLHLKKDYENSPSFYFDCAHYFISINQSNTGLRVLSNIAEMEMENPALLRLLAHRLAEMKYLELAELFFRQVLELRPEEPQSYRDLALVLQANKKYREAAKWFYYIITHSWDTRFTGIETIILMELNNTLRKASGEGLKGLAQELDIDPRLLQLLDVDIRIILTWDADMTDMDLWVTDPFNEKTYYSHNLSSIGSMISNDITNGYGPEEFLLKKAPQGTYKIQVNYFGSNSVRLLGPVTVRVDIFTHYGRSDESLQTITRRLEEKNNIIDLGEIKF